MQLKDLTTDLFLLLDGKPKVKVSIDDVNVNYKDVISGEADIIDKNIDFEEVDGVKEISSAEALEIKIMKDYNYDDTKLTARITELQA